MNYETECGMCGEKHTDDFEGSFSWLENHIYEKHGEEIRDISKEGNSSTMRKIPEDVQDQGHPGGGE
jgi:hypothetical protein